MSKTNNTQFIYDLSHKFYRKFDHFITAKWCPTPLQSDSDISMEDRKNAYKNFYQKVKKANIANRQTIQKWFGVNGKTSIPSRHYIFKIGLALHLSVQETQEYLQFGISQPGFQENDYEEFIIMYCLDHSLGIDTCRKMISFYEEKSHYHGKWLQKKNTEWLRGQYEIVKEYTADDFLVWMHKQQKYFKGYSLTILNCYRSLISQCLQFLRKDVKETLDRTLAQNGFFEWFSPDKREHVYTESDINRYVKNRLRSKTNPMSRHIAQEIRSMVSIVYASQDRICDLILELYDSMPIKKKQIDTPNIYTTLGHELKLVDKKYISELLNIAILKEKQMLLQMEIASETDDKLRKEKEKALKKFKQRIHLIQRSDILILTQYIFYKRNAEQMQSSVKPYDSEKLQKDFTEYVNNILDICTMRKLDTTYMLDSIMLSCFAQNDMYLFVEICEETTI